MPVSYFINTQLGLIQLHATGVVRDEDLLQAMRGLHADARFRRELRLLGDFTGVTENLLTSAGMSRCAQLNQFTEEAGKAVVVRGPAEFGMFRVYEAYCSLHHKPALQVFRSRADAIRYLNAGIPPSQQIPSDEPECAAFADCPHRDLCTDLQPR